MIIGGVQKFTLVDYPEKLACTLFFSGCSFRCPWCHNPELVVPERIREQPEFETRDVLRFLKERKGELEGVVLTGGEPTIHSGLYSFCGKIKEMEYLVKLDTNGSNPEALRKLVKRGLVDYVAMDVKAPLEKYGEVAGLDRLFEAKGNKAHFWREQVVRRVEESVEFLKRGKVECEFRTTVVPGLLTKEDVLAIARWIEPAPRFTVQEFRPGKKVDSSFEASSVDDDFILKIYNAVDPLFPDCRLRRA